MPLSPNAQFAYDYFRRNGFSDVAAAGLVGTLMGESGQGLNTASYNPNDPGGAYGILQATGGSGRAQTLRAYQDPNAKSELERQLSYVLHELRGSEKRAGGMFSGAKSLEDATLAGLKYLRPADQAVGGRNYNRRLGYAQGVLSGSGTAPAPQMGNLNAPSVPQPAAYVNQDLSQYYARKGIDTSGFGGVLNKGLYEMLGALPPELRGQITISSGFRTPERQAQLWQQALTKYKDPNVARRWVAPPGRSQHGFGNAADLQFGSDAARQWAHQNAEKYGLKFALGNEPWHIEAAGARAGGKPVNYALNVGGSGGGAAPGGVMTATGEAPDAPIQTANATEAGTQAFNEAFQAQQQQEANQKTQQAQQAAQEAAQQAQQQEQQRPVAGPGNPSQESAASLMASVLDKKRIARAGPVPGVLSAWSA